MTEPEVEDMTRAELDAEIAYLAPRLGMQGVCHVTGADDDEEARSSVIALRTIRDFRERSASVESFLARHEVERVRDRYFLRWIIAYAFAITGWFLFIVAHGLLDRATEAIR